MKLMDDERVVEVKSEYDIVIARAVVRAIAKDMGFGLVDQTRIATAVSELARNIVVHAGEGIILVREIIKGGSRGVEVLAIDQGPGISNIELVLRDGYSSKGSLGVGLGGAKRLVDEFEIKSAPGKGTTVRIVKWLSVR